MKFYAELNGHTLDAQLMSDVLVAMIPEDLRRHLELSATQGPGADMSKYTYHQCGSLGYYARNMSFQNKFERQARDSSTDFKCRNLSQKRSVVPSWWKEMPFDEELLAAQGYFGKVVSDRHDQCTYR